MDLVLRPYQSSTLDQIRAQIRDKKTRILIVAPTGAGKTIMFAAIAHFADKKNSRTLAIMHRRELVLQTLDKYKRLGISAEKIGIHCSNHPDRNDDAPHQIATVQTLQRRKIPPADILVVDEAHHVMAESYQKILQACPSAMVLGFTATPIRNDKKGLGDLFDVLICSAKPSELIQQGYLVKSTVLSHSRKPDLSGVHTRLGEYVQSELEQAVSHRELIGDLVEFYKKHGQNQRAICFAVTIEHSKKIVHQFVQAGISAEHVDAKTPQAERDAIFARLREGKTRMVSNVFVASEGWDLPSCKVLICARPTQSLAVWIQMAGRVLRVDDTSSVPAKEQKAIILDHTANCERFGMPDYDWPWTLEGSQFAGTGDAPTKHCQTFSLERNSEGKYEADGCEALSPTASRECIECGHPFYPQCPRCRPAWINGRFSPRCTQCKRGIVECDMRSPPATLRCPCCNCLFVPFRNLSLEPEKTELVERTQEDIEEQQREQAQEQAALVAPTDRQIEVLRKAGIDDTGLSKEQASDLISEIIRRRSHGLCSLKQVKLLARYGYDANEMSFDDARTTIDQLAQNGWRRT